MKDGLRWIVHKTKSGTRLQFLVYFKDGRKLATGFIVSPGRGKPWVAWGINGNENIFIKQGQHESCRLWTQRFAEFHIENSVIIQLEK